MTIFAGAFSLDRHTPLPDSLRAALRRHVSRFEGDTASEIDRPGVYLAKVDIGSFGGGGAHVDGSGNATLLAGEPLLAAGEGDDSWNREKDMALLHPALASGSMEGLKQARGTFCGLHYNEGRHELALFVDKVGVRPLYVWIGPTFAVFSTALRVLEAVPHVPKKFDVRGVTEIAAFTYALGDRTAYVDIAMLRPGELVRLGGKHAVREQYWRWDGPLRQVPHQEAVQHCYDQFMAALRRRQRRASIGAAFLSGGLDSRAIVGGLHAIGSDVYTVNYAPDGSQDQVFAALVAKKLGIHYTQIETHSGNVEQGYRKAEVAKWIKSTFATVDNQRHPPVLWSGDGGSVALGHVYLNRKIFELMGRGQVREAVALLNNAIGKRIFRRGVRESISGLPTEGVLEELGRIESADAGRKFHLFLMFNDQRRHLARHFEDIDLERIEFQLPFFDADYLETILRLPSETFLGHHFYMDWLALFPNGLNSVPWQAYPGHVPCTLPSPPGLKYQWDEYYDKEMYRQMQRATAERGSTILADRDFPHHLISRVALNLAVLVTRSGVRNYGYLINTAHTYHRYWKVCAQASDHAVAAG